MTKKGLIVILMALFVVAAFGSAFAGQTNGMATNNGPALPLAGLDSLGANSFAAANGSLTDGLDVYVNPDGLGDVLIYNYFNARNGLATYFDVVNTSSVPIRARVRFHEGANVAASSTCNSGSWEILDFDICLTPNDMWTAYVKQKPGGTSGQVCSTDIHTLTWDNVTSHTLGNAAVAGHEGCYDFKYGSSNPVSGITADNTLEGYFTIIGEYVQDNVPYLAANYTCNPNVAHGGQYVPAPDVPNVLFGYAFVADITDPANSPFYGYNATALADFANVAVNPTNTGFGTEFPRLIDGGDLWRGVDYILTKEQLMTTYLLWDSWKTELVLTFPTKRYNETLIFTCPNNKFTDTRVVITVWDEDENTKTTGCQNSPCVGASDDRIPYELNVIPINMGTAGSAVNTIMPTTLHPTDGAVISNGSIRTQDYDTGWVNINLNAATTALAPLHQTIANEGIAGNEYINHGWPVLSLSLVNYKNYSGAVPMKAITSITTVTPGLATTPAPY